MVEISHADTRDKRIFVHTQFEKFFQNVIVASNPGIHPSQLPYKLLKDAFFAGATAVFSPFAEHLAGMEILKYGIDNLEKFSETGRLAVSIDHELCKLYENQRDLQNMRPLNLSSAPSVISLSDLGSLQEPPKEE